MGEGYPPVYFEHCTWGKKCVRKISDTQGHLGQSPPRSPCCKTSVTRTLGLQGTERKGEGGLAGCKKMDGLRLTMTMRHEECMLKATDDSAAAETARWEDMRSSRRTIASPFSF